MLHKHNDQFLILTLNHNLYLNAEKSVDVHTRIAKKKFVVVIFVLHSAASCDVEFG